MPAPAPTTTAKPHAHATIEPKGRRGEPARDYAITLELGLGTGGSEAQLVDLARRAFAGFSPSAGEPDRRRFGALLSKRGSVIVGVEGSVVWPRRPDEAAVVELRAALLAGGYRVKLRELRECSRPECLSEAMVEWNQPERAPPGWHTGAICGKHGYKRCACGCVYIMESSSADAPAPSVHCPSCNVVMVEWGGTKLWSLELVA